MHNSLHGLRIIWVNTWGLVANVANVGSGRVRHHSEKSNYHKNNNVNV